MRGNVDFANLFMTLKQGAKAAAPTTRDCPFCFSAMPIKAKRCPNCTSRL